MRTWARIPFAVLAVGLLVHVAHAVLGFGGAGADHLIGDVDYVAVLAGSAVLCVGI